MHDATKKEHKRNQNSPDLPCLSVSLIQQMPFLLIKFLHLFLLCRDKCPYAFLKIIL
jgi:hypothetical protein